MANTDMILSYLGTMLGQLGSALGGNQQNLVQYGDKAAALNQQALAAAKQKEQEKKQKEQEDKGLLGSILNIGGDIASVAFPEAAVPIQIATKAGSGAVTGGSKGAISGGLNAALPSALNAIGTDGAAAGGKDISVNPITGAPGEVTPQQLSEIQKKIETGSSAPAEPLADNRPDGFVGPPIQTDEKNFVNPAPPVNPEQQKSSLFSTIIHDPTFQGDVRALTSQLTAPKRPSIDTTGLYPEIAQDLQNRADKQYEADRQYKLDQENTAARNKYYDQQTQFEKQRLDIQQQRLSATQNVNKAIPINQGNLIQMKDGSVATVFRDASGNISIQPVPNAQIQQKTGSMVNIGGFQVPAGDLPTDPQERIKYEADLLKQAGDIKAQNQPQWQIRQLPDGSIAYVPAPRAVPGAGGVPGGATGGAAGGAPSSGGVFTIPISARPDDTRTDQEKKAAAAKEVSTTVESVTSQIDKSLASAAPDTQLGQLSPTHPPAKVRNAIRTDAIAYMNAQINGRAYYGKPLTGLTVTIDNVTADESGLSGVYELTMNQGGESFKVVRDWMIASAPPTTDNSIPVGPVAPAQSPYVTVPPQRQQNQIFVSPQE